MKTRIYAAPAVEGLRVTVLYFYTATINPVSRNRNIGQSVIVFMGDRTLIVDNAKSMRTALFRASMTLGMGVP